VQEVTIKGKGKGDLSVGGRYLVLQSQPSYLYVQSATADKPRYCNYPELATVQCNGRGYFRYQPLRKFLSDCLHTAEEIIYKQELGLGEDRTQVEAEPFGVSDQSNIRIAKERRGKSNTNEGARPGLEEAYVIVSTKLQSKYPYHAAAVVAIDGTDTVTLEVFAGDTDAQQHERTTPGEFKMYSATTSFHSVWSTNAVFAETNPVTMVLKPIVPIVEQVEPPNKRPRRGH
jgi:hypothetical protein